MVELLIVLTIIGILAAATTLSFSSRIEQAKLDHAAARLLSDLQLVRNQALRLQQPTTLEFDGARNCNYSALTVARRPSRDPIQVALDEDPYDISLVTLAFLPSGQNSNAITFDARGEPQANALIKLFRGSRFTRIQISPRGNIEQVE